MLRIYKSQNSRLVLVDPLDGLACQEPVIWFDLFNPSSEETRLVEERLGIAIPTRDEMQEIELSDRLYQEDGAEFMTMTATAKLDSDYPAKVPVTFILKGATLVTVRHAEPKPFQVYANRIMKPNGAACETGELVMLGLLEAMIDRTADALERAGNDVDQISREVFRKSNASATKKTRDLQSLIEQIGQKGDLLPSSAKARQHWQARRLSRRHRREHAPQGGQGEPAADKARSARRGIPWRPRAVPVEQDQFPARRDAGAHQPRAEPDHQDLFGRRRRVPAADARRLDLRDELRGDAELTWRFGYPYALILMIASALLPYVYFKRRGWL